MAELIDGVTNIPVWTDQNNGELTDVLAIQSDIAMSIANSLQASFSVDEWERIETTSTDSPEAYALYLSAWQRISDRGTPTLA